MDNNINVSKLFGPNPEWLAQGTWRKPANPMEIAGMGLGSGIASVTIIGSQDSLGDDNIQIRGSELKFSAGNERSPHFDELEDSVLATYRWEWFIKEGLNAETAKRFKVHGDLMEPFLYDGDTVLINLAETSVINGKVYALHYGDELHIKRVYKKIDGSLILHIDNPDYLPRDEEIAATTINEYIGIIGRVRDKSGSGGL